MYGARNGEELFPHNLGPQEVWGQITDAGNMVTEDETISFVAVADSPLLPEGIFVTSYEDRVVVSSSLPVKLSFDKVGNRILTRYEAIAKYMEKGSVSVEDLILPISDLQLPRH